MKGISVMHNSDASPELIARFIDVLRQTPGLLRQDEAASTADLGLDFYQTVISSGLVPLGQLALGGRGGRGAQG